LLRASGPPAPEITMGLFAFATKAFDIAVVALIFTALT
jgi:hypothetical protein